MIGIAKTLKLSFTIGALLLFFSSLLTIYNSHRWSSEGLAFAQARASLSQLPMMASVFPLASIGRNPALSACAWSTSLPASSAAP